MSARPLRRALCAWASLALALTALTPSLASACDCVASTPCQAVANADAVFVGRVISVTEVLDGQPLRRLVRLAVSESFIGGQTDVGGQTGEIEVRTGVGGGDCGYRFDVGSTYVVYAHRTDAGQLSTGICTRTAKTALNGEEISMLRGLNRSPESTGRVRGEVSAERRREDGRIDRRRASGVVVVATPADGAAAVRITTDREGRFDLALPPGRYEITAEAGAGLRAPDRSWSVNVFGGADCARVWLALRLAGSSVDHPPLR